MTCIFNIDNRSQLKQPKTAFYIPYNLNDQTSCCNNEHWIISIHKQFMCWETSLIHSSCNPRAIPGHYCLFLCSNVSCWTGQKVKQKRIYFCSGIYQASVSAMFCSKFSNQVVHKFTLDLLSSHWSRFITQLDSDSRYFSLVNHLQQSSHKFYPEASFKWKHSTHLHSFLIGKDD